MRITLNREKFTENSTIGTLYLDGVKECVCLEDVVREGEKVSGKTAIPAGTYEVIIDFSNRFGRMMPHLLSVPNFEGIRIHSGNTDKDTEGCILLGMSNPKPDFIANSRAAFESFYPKLQSELRRGQVFIDIVNLVPHLT